MSIIQRTRETLQAFPKTRTMKLSLIVFPLLIISAFVPLSLNQTGAAHAASSCPPTVAIGSSGTWVKRLQGSLNAHDREDAGRIGEVFTHSPYPFSAPLATDSGFGSQTQAAVKDYQAASHLAVDGQVGPNTWGALGYCDWNGGSGTSGGGCKTTAYARTCISVDSLRLAVTNVYITHASPAVLISLLEDGSIVQTVELNGGFAAGADIRGPQKQISAGHTWQTMVTQGVDFFADVNDPVTFSPVQYT